jgi:molybdate transport system substrate-binding protein
MRRLVSLMIVVLALTALPDRSVAGPPRPLVVYAAASLTDVLQELGASYEKSGGGPVRLSFAASSALARQIESGAEADLFFSADQEWMNYLDQRHLLREGTRVDLLGNRLALVAPVTSNVQLTVGPGFALRAALHDERLATGDPDSVPVGRYAKAALTTLGVWNDVADRLVRAENVRSALAFVARGEVPLAIVYETDARVDPKVRVVALFPESSHPPIRYPVALTRGAAPEAAALLAYLRGPDAASVFRRYGFSVLRGDGGR